MLGHSKQTDSVMLQMRLNSRPGWFAAFRVRMTSDDSPNMRSYSIGCLRPHVAISHAFYGSISTGTTDTPERYITYSSYRTIRVLGGGQKPKGGRDQKGPLRHLKSGLKISGVQQVLYGTVHLWDADPCVWVTPSVTSSGGLAPFQRAPAARCLLVLPATSR